MSTNLDLQHVVLWHQLSLNILNLLLYFLHFLEIQRHTINLLYQFGAQFFIFLKNRNYGGRSRQDATPLEIELDIASVRETTGVGPNLCESGDFA